MFTVRQIAGKDMDCANDAFYGVLQISEDCFKRYSKKEFKFLLYDEMRMMINLYMDEYKNYQKTGRLRPHEKRT